MSTRLALVHQATRRAKYQLDTLTRELIHARHKCGLSQAHVARALGVSRPLVAAWESGRRVPTPVQLYQWGAVLGLDVSIRAYPGGAPLRDSGQLRILARFKATVGDLRTWQTEVPVSLDPSDRRAFDAVLSRDLRRAAVEAVSRLGDAEGQVRPITLKQQASEIPCVLLALADTRHNRLALIAGLSTIQPAFPCPARSALAALRRGDLPSGNAVLLV